MRRSFAAAAVAMSTILSVMSAGGSSATDGKPAPDAPTFAAQRAERALTRAHEALAGGPGAGRGRPEVTLALRDLFLSLPSLDASGRRQAGTVLARPTDGASDPNGDGYSMKSRRKCAGAFCIHWVPSTSDAPPSADWVDRSLRTMRAVWRLEVGKLNYRRPIRDGQRGGDNRFDVYLKDVGSRGLYGYCAPEELKPGTKFLASGYCVLDNDFARAQFNDAPPVDSLRVTAAHEFFHAVQFAYDVGEDPWFMETTATWMEERFADRVNDNRQYLPYGQVARPSTPLDVFADTGYNQYGNWPFFEFLSTRFGRGVVRAIWNQAGAFEGAPDRYSAKAIVAVLAHHGGFAGVFSRYAAGNTMPARTYPEGETWPKAPMSARWVLSSRDRSAATTFTIGHLSSRNARAVPDASLVNRHWGARVVVNGPDRVTSPTAYAIVRMTDGDTVKRAVHLDSGGRGSTVVPFSHARVAGVTVTLANASTRFRCWHETNLSCQGRPRDNGLDYHLRVVAFRR